MTQVIEMNDLIKYIKDHIKVRKRYQKEMENMPMAIRTLEIEIQIFQQVLDFINKEIEDE